MSGSPGHEAALAVSLDWAIRTADVRAVALVGSVARGAETEGSDVDLVVLTTDPSRYASSAAWIDDLGLGTRIRTARWGPITEHRIELPSGLEVELGVGPLAWAAEPVDAGTRRVVRDGMQILYDPDDRLGHLADAVASGS